MSGPVRGPSFPGPARGMGSRGKEVRGPIRSYQERSLQSTRRTSPDGDVIIYMSPALWSSKIASHHDHESGDVLKRRSRRRQDMSGTRDPTPKELADYHERRIAVRDKFEAIGWGSRSSAAFDLRMHATLISDTLNGTRVTRSSEELLERLEAWADAKLVQERLHAAAGLPT